MMMKLGILGLGAWGRRMVNSVHGKSAAARFVAGFNRTPSKVADFARERDIRLSGDLKDVLADPEVDGVVVVGPAALHAPQAMQAVEAGKHALVVKPLALGRADAEALCAAAKANGVTVVMGYDRCFAPNLDVLRARFAAGDLGDIVHAEGDFCVDRYFGFDRDDWKASTAHVHPGALADHMLYAMIELLGPVEEVAVRALSQATDLDAADTATTSLRFAGGASGLLTAIGVTANFHRLHLFGTKGWAELRGNRDFTFQPVGGKAEVLELPANDPVRDEIEAFVAAAQGTAPYPITPETAIAGVAALEAMGRSAADGGAVIKL